MCIRISNGRHVCVQTGSRFHSRWTAADVDRYWQHCTASRLLERWNSEIIFHLLFVHHRVVLDCAYCRNESRCALLAGLSWLSTDFIETTQLLVCNGTVAKNFEMVLGVDYFTYLRFLPRGFCQSALWEDKTRKSSVFLEWSDCLCCLIWLEVICRLPLVRRYL